MKLLLNGYERAILKALHSSMRPMSAREVSEKAGISWVTARKYLRRLAEKGLVEESSGEKGFLRALLPISGEGAGRERSAWELNWEGIFGTTTGRRRG